MKTYTPGISNRLSSEAERAEREKILENYPKRLRSGRVGTHEGRTKKAQA